MANIYKLLLAQIANLNANNGENFNAPLKSVPFERIIPSEMTEQYQRFLKRIETSEDVRSELVNLDIS